MNMANLANEQEIQRICIALAQDKDSYLYLYKEDAQTKVLCWTLSNVVSYREFIFDSLKDTVVSQQDLDTLSREKYEKVSLDEAAWFVPESVISEMADCELVTFNDNHTIARATDLAYEVGQSLIDKYNL